MALPFAGFSKINIEGYDDYAGMRNSMRLCLNTTLEEETFTERNNRDHLY